MVKRCFIVDCCTGTEQENGPAIFFTIPKHRLEEWRVILPKMGLLASSRLCWRHFDEDDIIKAKFILGQFHPQQRWRLKDGAAPKHLLGPTRQQNNRHPALEDLPLNGPVKKKKLQPRSKTITSILGTPISSIVQNQLTTIHHTDRRNGSQPTTKLLCTNALSDSGSSHVMFEDDTDGLCSCAYNYCSNRSWAKPSNV